MAANNDFRQLIEELSGLVAEAKGKSTSVTVGINVAPAKAKAKMAAFAGKGGGGGEKKARKDKGTKKKKAVGQAHSDHYPFKRRKRLGLGPDHKYHYRAGVYPWRCVCRKGMSKCGGSGGGDE